MKAITANRKTDNNRSLRFLFANFLDESSLLKITELETICKRAEPIAFKFELDYKYKDVLAKNIHDHITDKQNEFYCYDGEKLVGYVGICQFGSGTIEVSGMTHPEYRNLGIFSTLMNRVYEEARKRNSTTILLLVDKNSESGRNWIEHRTGRLDHVEYEMFLPNLLQAASPCYEIVLSKATNNDILEINKQNASLSGRDEDSDPRFPEEEEKRGMRIFLVRKEQVVLGKIHLQSKRDSAWIFGFFVYPEFRGLGYGKSILSESIRLLHSEGLCNIYLQVDSLNEAAFSLYKKIGFKVLYAMEYYEMNVANEPGKEA